MCGFCALGRCTERAKKEREREIRTRGTAGSPWKFTRAQVTVTCLWLVGEKLGSEVQPPSHPSIYTAARLSHPRLRAKGRQGFGSVVGWRRRHRRVGKRDEETGGQGRGGGGSHSLEGREEADGKGEQRGKGSETDEGGTQRYTRRGSVEGMPKGIAGGEGDGALLGRRAEQVADHAEVGRLAFSLAIVSSSSSRFLRFPVFSSSLFLFRSLSLSLFSCLSLSLSSLPSRVSSRHYLFLSLLSRSLSPVFSRYRSLRRARCIPR